MMLSFFIFKIANGVQKHPNGKSERTAKQANSCLYLYHTTPVYIGFIGFVHFCITPKSRSYNWQHIMNKLAMSAAIAKSHLTNRE